MTKQEAAMFLGVSTRTLERLVKQGKINQGRVLRDKRARSFFEPAELEQYKQSDRQVFRRLNTAIEKSSVGFRLDPYYAERLQNEGEKRGLSAGEYARILVMRTLEGNEHREVLGEIVAMRKALARATFLNLVSERNLDHEVAIKLVQEIAGSESEL